MKSLKRFLDYCKSLAGFSPAEKNDTETGRMSEYLVALWTRKLRQMTKRDKRFLEVCERHMKANPRGQIVTWHFVHESDEEKKKKDWHIT